MCVFGIDVLSDWTYGDDPMEQHREDFPACAFVRGLDVRNVPFVYTLPLYATHHVKQAIVKYGITEHRPSSTIETDVDVSNLSEAVECNVCLEHKLKVVFLPYGHMACQVCASNIENCHICRKKYREL